MSTALLFSGQGSQYVGMTADLCEQYTIARDLAKQANDVLGFDIHSLMVAGPVETLTQTRYTQPALFLHEAMVLSITDVATHVHAVAGHSLGEFSALYAAGVVSYADALRLVQKRGELMYETGLRIPGTMAAILGLDNETVDEICRELSTSVDHVLVPANYNSTGQVVISGSADLVRSSLAVFKERGARMAKELQVSGAFHSPLLSTATPSWREFVESVEFSAPRLPVYVNVTGSPTTDPRELREAAIGQMTSAVLWTQTLQHMAQNGIRKFIEVGPQAVLQGLVKRTLEGVEISGLDKADDCKQYLEGHGGSNG